MTGCTVSSGLLWPCHGLCGLETFYSKSFYCDYFYPSETGLGKETEKEVLTCSQGQQVRLKPVPLQWALSQDGSCSSRWATKACQCLCVCSLVQCPWWYYSTVYENQKTHSAKKILQNNFLQMLIFPRASGSLHLNILTSASWWHYKWCIFSLHFREKNRIFFLACVESIYLRLTESSSFNKGPLSRSISWMLWSSVGVCDSLGINRLSEL